MPDPSECSASEPSEVGARPTDPAGDLRRLIEAHDVPCAACGYNLRGCPGAACPECARPISLEHARAYVDFRRWRAERLPSDRLSAAGMIGAFVGFGLCVSVAVSASILFAARGGGQGVIPLGRVATSLLVAVGLQVGFVILFVAHSARTATRARRTRVWLVVAAWVLCPLIEMILLAVSAWA